MMDWNLYRSRIQVWTQFEKENAQRININSENYMILKQETIKNNKSTTRSNDNDGITWLRQNLTWFKKENTQIYDRQQN